MGFFSLANLFHRDNHNHSKSESVLQTSTGVTTLSSSTKLAALRTTDDLALNGKLSDTSLVSRSSSAVSNSTSRNRHSMDSSGSSSSWSLSSNGGQLTLNHHTTFPSRSSISSSHNSTHHQQYLSVQPNHHSHHHHHHHGPIHISTRVSIRDFAKQYLELMEIEKTRALLQNSLAQNLDDPLSIQHHSVVTKSLNVIVETKSSQNPPEEKKKNTLLRDASEVDPANELVLENVETKNANEPSSISHSDTSVDTSSSEVSPAIQVNVRDKVNNTSSNDSNDDTQNGRDTSVETTPNNQPSVITTTEEQKKNHHEKASFKKFLAEHENYLSSLDEIFQVCIYGHVERLKSLLEEIRQKSNRFSLSMKSLRLSGSVKVKKFISREDSGKTENVKKQSWSNCTLVHLAARFNQVDVLDMLLKIFIGMNETLSDVINLEDDIHATPLFYSVTSGAYESTAFLCSFSNAIKINTKDVFECSPLWYAMHRKDFEMADILITFGADIYFKIHGGESYLHRACEMNDVDMIKYILLGIRKEESIDLINNTKQNQIFQERQSLMLRCDQRHQIPLFNAIKSYEEFLRRKKLQSAASRSTTTPSTSPPTNNNPSHPFSEPKEQAFDFLLNFFTQHCPSILQKSLDQTNHYGHSMIHFCVERDAFQPLLKIIRLYDSDDKLKQALNEKDKILGNTPLHIAIMTTHYDCFKLLVSCQEVDLNIPNQQLDLPLHVAIRQKKLRMIQYLYSLYSQKDLETKNAQHLSCLKLAKRLSLNLKKLAEGNIEEFEKELKSKEKKNEKKWWHIFKIHKKSSHTPQEVASNASSTTSTEETLSSSNLSSLAKNTLDTLSSSSSNDVSQSQATTTFPLVHWTKDLTLGVEIMDEQHHGLVDIINKLIQLMFGGENDCNVPERSSDEWLLGYVIGLCLEYTEFHFETEERIMAKYAKSLPEGYAEEHHQEHEEFTNKMKKLHQEYLDNHSTISFLNVDLLNYLLHWLINHIMGSDHVFVSHLTKDVPPEQISL
nr:unnamed protein product [Naegleria fowleri]